jgi:hypothetical protein
MGTKVCSGIRTICFSVTLDPPPPDYTVMQFIRPKCEFSPSKTCLFCRCHGRYSVTLNADGIWCLKYGHCINKSIVITDTWMRTRIIFCLILLSPLFVFKHPTTSLLQPIPPTDMEIFRSVIDAACTTYSPGSHIHPTRSEMFSSLFYKAFCIAWNSKSSGNFLTSRLREGSLKEISIDNARIVYAATFATGV